MIHVKGGVQKKVEKELRRLPMVSALGTFVLCLQHEIQPILMPSQASCGEEMRVDTERERELMAWLGWKGRDPNGFL
jgi:hypothetical protein